MVQREAAQRLAALPGTRGAGAVSYAVHYYACPQVLFSVQPGSFYPPPKVTSAVLRLSLHAAPPVAPQSERAMFRTIPRGVQPAGAKRRPTPSARGWAWPKAQVAAALQAVGAPPSARPEQLGAGAVCRSQRLLLPAE